MFQVELRVERSLTWTLLGRCVTWRPRGRSPASRLVWEHLGVPLEELERVSEASLRMEIGLRMAFSRTSSRGRLLWPNLYIEKELICELREHLRDGFWSQVLGVTDAN